MIEVEMLLKLNRFDDAMRVLTKAAEAAPNDPNLPRLKAQAWLLRNDYESALVEAKKALPKFKTATTTSC